LTTYDLTISVVSYNTRDYLRQCLNSIYENTQGISFEIIVVDNASTDGSAEMVAQQFPSVHLIKNNENRFFSGGHNQALAIASGQFFLILNPDTIVPTGTLPRLVRFLKENPKVGAVSCREYDSNGNLVVTAGNLPGPAIQILEWTYLRGRVFKRAWDRFRLVDWNRDSLRRVDVVSGCFIMARTTLLRKIKGFDERIRLYFTEHDLCWNIGKADYEIYFVPDAHYIHAGQRSTSQYPKEYIRKILFEDMIQYYTPRYGRLRSSLVMLTIRFLRKLERTLYYLWPPRWFRFAMSKLVTLVES